MKFNLDDVGDAVSSGVFWGIVIVTVFFGAQWLVFNG